MSALARAFSWAILAVYVDWAAADGLDPDAPIVATLEDFVAGMDAMCRSTHLRPRMLDGFGGLFGNFWAI